MSKKQKVLFIENRNKTYFWDAVSKNILKKHEVFWIVQNNLFKPNFGKSFHIPYPKKSQLSKVKNDDFSFIESTDRMINYFGINADHYSYYYNQINNIIEKVNPDMVFGEATQFFELMVVKLCKEKKIPFYNPSPSSYPPSKFFFFKNDTKFPFELNKKNGFDNNISQIINSINERKAKPDYMLGKKIKVSPFKRFKQLLEYLKGERFATPRLDRKICIEAKKKYLKNKLNKISVNYNTIPKNKKILLYPMQLQPEANIDIWGNNFKDQNKLILNISEKIPKNWILAVKTNPKSHYEINSDFIDIIKNRENIFLLKKDTSMNEIFNKSDAVASITGTVAIECILASKPLINLGNTFIKEAIGAYTIKEINHIVNALILIDTNQFKTANNKDKENFMRYIVDNSLNGIIADPIENPDSMEDRNIEMVSDAFLKIISGNL